MTAHPTLLLVGAFVVVLATAFLLALRLENSVPADSEESTP